MPIPMPVFAPSERLVFGLAVGSELEVGVESEVTVTRGVLVEPAVGAGLPDVVIVVDVVDVLPVSNNSARSLL